MAQFYLGSTALNQLWLGNTQINNVPTREQFLGQIIITGPSASTLFPTQTSLEAKLTNSIITDFQIVGTNVYASSSVYYTPSPSMFSASLGITSVTMDGALSVSSFMFVGSTITSASFENAISVGDSAFNGATSLSYVNLPKVESLIQGNNFRTTTNLSFIDLPSLTSADGNQNFNGSGIVTFSGSVLPSIPRIFQNTSALRNVYTPVATSIAGDAFGQSGLIIFSGSSILTLANNAFRTATSMQQIWLPGLSGSTAIGGSTGATGTFQDIKTSGSISVPSFYATVNGGSPDGDLVYLSGTRGWTINYL